MVTLVTKDTIFIGIGNHTILFTASLYCTQVPTTFSTERSGRGRSATHSCATSHVACDASHSSDHLGLEQSTPKASYIESPQYQADTTPSVPKVVNVIANRQIAPKDSYKLVLEEPPHSKSILREGILTWRNPSL